MDTNSKTWFIFSTLASPLILAVLLSCFAVSDSQFAKSSYYMDTQSDCGTVGWMLLATDGVVNVFSRKPGTTTSSILSCSLRFKPSDERDILDVSFRDVVISDRDVTMRVELSGASTYVLTAGVPKPTTMTSVGGNAVITLTRTYLEDNDYYIYIIIRAYKKDDTGTAKDESPVAVGLVVGIVGGVIGFLVILFIIIVCCWRKRHRNTAKPISEYKTDLTNEQVSPSDRYGLENTARNGTSPPRRSSSEYYDDSPRMKKQLLMQGNRNDYRDQSDTESETKDPYIMKKFDQSPKKVADFDYEDENKRRAPLQSNVQMRNPPPAPRPPPVAAPRQDVNQNRTDAPPKSPFMDAMHKNPRFRASFLENDADAEDRAQRISGSGSESVQNPKDDGHESDASVTMTWNTTFDTNFDDDPRPPAGSFRKPPDLPPVPKSPKAPLRRSENTASIRRVPRPSSSSSEIEQIGNGDGKFSMNPQGDDGPPARSEVVPIRIYDPHSPNSKRKADTQHKLKPDRGAKTKPTKEKRKASPESRMSDSPGSERKNRKSTKTTTEKPKPEKSSKAASATPDYETGRFRKADSARKIKSKTPRLGRSRSTGTALDDDASSIGHATIPKGYQAVPKVTADDYEDSDVESNLNYNPLRRSGSKNSLYASRSSLYGRRRRKNSAGESVYSFAHDDIDTYRDKDRDSFKERSLSRRDRAFRSLGDLERELRDSATRSTQTLRECATQTGAGFANVQLGKKTVVKKSRPKSVSSSQTQTAKSKSKSKDLDTSSSSSGVYKQRERTNSTASTNLTKPRERRNSGSSTGGKPRRAKSESELKKKVDAERKKKDAAKPKPAPKPKPRKSMSNPDHLSDDDLESVATGPIDQSSVAGGRKPQPLNPAMMGQPIYPQQAYPGYPMGYPPPHMAYPQAMGQPVMMPYGQPGGMLTQGGGGGLNSGGISNVRPTVPPGMAPKPSKWEMLCKITDGDKSGESSGSVASNPYGALHIPPGYTSAVGSEYGSEYSGPGRSAASGRPPQIPKKSSWDTLKQMAVIEGSQYSASESNI